MKTVYRLSPACLCAILFLTGLGQSEVPSNYKGRPFRNQIQSVPGTIYLWRYDSGGADIAWSDSNTSNPGDYHERTTNGIEDKVGLKKLNRAWDQMAPNAGPDTMIHYDDTNNIYLGYIRNKQWVKMTIDVKQAGTYQFDAMVTACCQPNSTTECLNPLCDPTIRIDFLNSTDSASTGPVTFTRTGYYHYYMYESNLSRVNLKQGIQLHKITILGWPPSNLWYFKYTLVSTPALERQNHCGNMALLKAERCARSGDGRVQIDFLTENRLPVTIECFTLAGQLESSRSFADVNKGLNRRTLTGHFPPGTKLVKLVQGRNATVSKLFLLQ
jgi:hypothetical protein